MTIQKPPQSRNGELTRAKNKLRAIEPPGSESFDLIQNRSFEVCFSDLLLPEPLGPANIRIRGETALTGW
jgi:hypothetical protein